MSMTTTTDVVPASVRLAAKRGFVRTTAQAYAAVIPAGGVSAAVLAQVVVHPSWVEIGAAAAAWVLSPILAGAASWLSIISKGVPDAYTSVVQAVPTAADTDAS